VSTIFEQPWMLLTIAVGVLLVLRILYWFLADKWRWWIWLLPVVIAISAFALDYFVVTDSEKIRQVIQTCIVDVEHENVDAFEKLFADDYHDSFHHDKESMMNNFRSMLSRPLVEKGHLKISALKINGTQAKVNFGVWINFEKESEIYRTYKPQAFVLMMIELQKQADKRWLISRAELLEADLQKVRWSDIHF
jgi:hypothetical protein